MKKTIGKKVLAVMLSLIMILSLGLTGCGSESTNTEDGNKTSDGATDTVSGSEAETTDSDVIMTIDDFDVTTKLYKLYVIQYLYNNKVASINIDDAKVTEIQDAIVSELKLEMVQYLLAQKTEGVVVDDEALAVSEKTAASFHRCFGEKFLKEQGLTYDDVLDLFTYQAYISRLKDKSIEDLKTDFTKSLNEQYKDLRFTSMYYALFPIVEYGEDNTPKKGDDGNAILLSDEEISKQSELANELKSRADKGEKMEDLVKEYKIEDYSGTERNYIGAYGQELNDIVAELKTGDISDVIETKAGYMVVRMDNDNDTEYRDFMITYAAGQSADNTFTTLQSNWMEASGVKNLQPNKAVIDSIDIKAICQKMEKNGYY